MRTNANRRRFLKALGLTAAAQIAPRALLAGDTADEHPNILIIHNDEHRIECLGAYGNRDIKTPHIDRLAAEGVRYDNSFCPFPVCTPSRYSLLSGRYVHEHRGWNNHSTLAPEIATFARMLRAAGYRVGTYTSPHLLRYNERVRLNGQPVNDALLIASFDRVDIAREETSLTYFEFGTLAALDIFYRENLDVVVLEVGLGGRLDAVNVIDPTIALITSISVDHAEWLGDDRESIALEKAGIMRAGRPVIFSGRDMPNSVTHQAREIKE